MSAPTATASRRRQERRRTARAVAGSVIFHILLILLVAWLLSFPPAIPPPQEADEAPVEITFVDPPRPPPQYMETSEDQRAEKPPENPVFESDKDTRAASALPASGDAPVPTLEGEIAPTLSMQNREHTPGREPRPAPPSAPGYQPQERITRIRGNISNRGRASVAANATPIGRYKKMLSDAIGSRWYYYVNNQMGLLSIGTLEVRFIVRENGRVENIRVVSNSSNESFAACSVQAIMEAEIPPIPKEIVPMLENGRIEIEYSFTIISN